MPSITPPDAPLAPTRKTCKLRGFTFPAPISLDEVPEFAGPYDAPNTRFFMLIMTNRHGLKIAETADYNRNETRRVVARGTSHWTKEGAERHARALRAINLYCIKHAT